ncbi:MAG: alpha/beta hydrolase [Candidatus Uhrbacteria bacterium]
MKNIFIFHGTAGCPEENWFSWLKEKLEKMGRNVIVPQFPTPEGQSLESWLKVLDKHKQYINADTIFIGHSLGGIFLLRILERLPTACKAAFFTGTPIGIKPIKNYDSDNSFSGFSFDWDNIKKKAGYFSVYHSDNDPYVSLGNGEELAKRLDVKLNLIPNAGHFNTRAGYTEFDRLWDELKSLL